jgi:hypothetical protein
VSLSDRLARLNQLQRSSRFKLVAAGLIVALALIGFAVWWTILNAPADAATAAPEPSPSAETLPSEATPEAEDGALAQTNQQFEPRLDPTTVLDAIGSRDATLGVALGLASAVALTLLVIWLGAGLTYLAIALIALIVVVPLGLFDPTRTIAILLAGLAALAASFTIFIETARALLSSSHPVFAIARTVVSEAVRMKISLVFILLLMGWLASLPFLLDDAQPLRFRVQTFLQNGTAGAFWSLALLTMFFSVATLAFEQRDKIIWSTIVKPVKAWHYVFGKWLGIMAVNGALLAVAASGIFLFTEYLRAQPARGEIAPYVAADGSGKPTKDRLILEARILTARAARDPLLPPITEEAIQERIRERVDGIAAAEAVPPTPEERRRLAEGLLPSVIERLGAQRTSIAPFDYKEYRFPDLLEAKRLGRPITFRYTVHAGANSPTDVFALLFEFVDSETGGTIPVSIDTPLDVAQRLDLRPNVISNDGELLVRIYNGDPARQLPNDLTIRFPPDGLQVLYAKGGYTTNFFRITVSLLVKLGFIAAAGIFAATFLSFPVAALFSFLILFAAETSGFLAGALDVYGPTTTDGEVSPFRVAIRAIATPIAGIFTGYRSLDAVDRLVDGRLLSWSEFVAAGAAIIAFTAAALAAAAAIFKRRELATYSGH